MAKKIEKRSDIIINGSIATYTFKHQSLNQGTLIGTFSFRCFLLPLQKLNAGRDKRELLGQFEALATDAEKFMAYCLSELKQRIITAPSFWNLDNQIGGNISEEDFIFKVTDAALYAEAMYAEIKKEERDNLVKAAMIEAEKLIEKNVEEKKTADEVEEIEDEISHS